MVFQALIHPGVEGSFVTEKVVQALSLKKVALHTSVTGLGGEVSAKSSATTTLQLRSRTNSVVFVSFLAVVLPRLTGLLPRAPVHLSDCRYLEGLFLADPEFDSPATVYCILGADTYPLLLFEGVIRGPPGTPVAQQTKLGWILTGPSSQLMCATAQFTLQLHTATLDTADQLRKF